MIPTYYHNGLYEELKEHTEHMCPLARTELHAEAELSLRDALKDWGPDYIPEQPH